MARIDQVHSREILDSRGYPTIESTVILDDGNIGVSSVPAGTSPGSFEAHELRDNDPQRFEGMGVTKAVEAVSKIISPALSGLEIKYQNSIDQVLVELDGTPDKSKLGVNTILSVSQAVLKASSASYHMPLYSYLWAKYGLADKSTSFPASCFNMLNGGSHGSGNLDFQEFLVIPSSRFSFAKSLEIASRIYQLLRRALTKLSANNSLGDDGGFTPNFISNMDALQMILDTLKKTNLEPNNDVFLALDVAASQFYRAGKYMIKDRAQSYSQEEFIAYFEELERNYHILLLEDPLYEDDWDGWKNLTALLGNKVVLLGDDLLCANIQRVQKAINSKTCNGIMIKPNQIGTITETVAVVKLCKSNGWQVVVSQRGSETNDDFIADFSVGIGANYTKFGAPARGERVAKYNRLLAISREIGENAG